MNWRRQVQTALKQSSVKGVGRLVKAESGHLKLLWTVATVLFLAMGFFQTYKLFDEYFSYPKVTLMQERKSSFNNGVLQFPAIQVCNVNSLGLFRNSPNKESVKQYMALVRNATTCNNCSEDDRRKLHQYVMHIDEEKVVALLSNYTDFLIECLVFVVGNAFGSDRSTVGNILVVPSVKHIVCLVLKHPETVAIYRLSMTFYIDNFDVNGS